MKTKKLAKIFTNIILLVCFLLTYFLDLTGLELHQYLGIAAGVMLTVHIITHADWIKQVSKRFFKSLKKRLRIYYILDVVLLTSIISITLTGVVISTWLMIDFTFYPIIRSIHIISSIIGLLLLNVKMILHWKFFSRLSKLIDRPKQKQTSSTVVTIASASKNTYTRREALKVIGAITVVGGLGLYKAVSAAYVPKTGSLPLPNVHTSSTQMTPAPGNEIAQVEPYVEASEDNSRKRRRGSSKVNNPIQFEDNVIPAAEPIPTPVMEQPAESPSTQDCVIRCLRGCNFPGQCSRYIDYNHNQLCDLGEYLIV